VSTVWPARLVLALLLSLGVVPVGAQSPAPQEERSAVVGAANPLDAPVLTGGAADDTIVESEVLWYAVDAAPGQQVTATVELLGRPDGGAVAGATVTAVLTDPQRQPLVQADAPFDGFADVRLELPTAQIPPTGSARPLLSVSLQAVDRSGGAEPDGIGGGHRLRLAVEVSGDPSALPAEQVEDAGAAAVPDEPAVVVTAAPVPQPGAPDIVADVLPFALMALAVGGVAGFELNRRGR
jgi:hypothetical protein